MALYDELGGAPCLDLVHNILYGKLLSHPWLKGFFHGKDRRTLESQQTDFITGVFGGPKIYGDRLPKSAHMHMFITEEVFTLRHGLLADSLTEAGVPAPLAERWLEHDMTMKRALVKDSPVDCKGRYNREQPLIVQNPGEGWTVGGGTAS